MRVRLAVHILQYFSVEEQEASGRIVVRSYVAFVKYFVHLALYEDGVSTRLVVADVYSALRVRLAMTDFSGAGLQRGSW